MRRMLLLLLLAAVAPAALGGYYAPKLERRKVTVAVGETVRVRVTAVYVPFPSLPSVMFTPWAFESVRPTIAAVHGSLQSVDGVGTMLITGRRQGETFARARPWDDQNVVDVTVVCPAEAPVQAAEPRQSTRPDVPVTLRAVTSAAAPTTLTWYHGRVGDMSAPIAASGPEIAFVSNDHGVQYAWVMATTPCSSSTAQFEIEVTAPKRRVARH